MIDTAPVSLNSGHGQIWRRVFGPSWAFLLAKFRGALRVGYGYWRVVRRSHVLHSHVHDEITEEIDT